MYHFIIATCAVLTVLAIYRVRLTRSFWASAALGAFSVAFLFILLIIIGALS